MNCEKYKAQIEERLGREALPIDVMRHIETCRDCRTFNGECAKLREMLDCLQAINAPNDFNFRLKARMKRAEKPVAIWTWQRMTGAGTVTLAALAIGFVLLNNPIVSTNTVNISNPIQPSVAQQLQPTSVAEAAPVEPPQQPVIEDKKEIAEFDKQKPQTAQRETRIARVRKAQPKNADDDEIKAKDSPLGGGGSADTALSPALPSIMPKGIPDQLQAPKKQNAGEILRTLGVETETASDGLRVTKSNRNDLKTGDVIQKVNDENPAAVSGGLLNEIKLTIRRQDQTKEVKILAKP